MGLFRAKGNKLPNKKMQMNTKWFKIRPGKRQNIWLFRSVADESNLGQPRTTAASVQNGT